MQCWLLIIGVPGVIYLPLVENNQRQSHSKILYIPTSQLLPLFPPIRVMHSESPPHFHQLEWCTLNRPHFHQSETSTLNSPPSVSTNQSEALWILIQAPPQLSIAKNRSFHSHPSVNVNPVSWVCEHISSKKRNLASSPGDAGGIHWGSCLQGLSSFEKSSNLFPIVRTHFSKRSEICPGSHPYHTSHCS